MKPFDMTAAMAAVVIGLGLVLNDLPVVLRAVVVVGAFAIYVWGADHRRTPTAMAAVLVVAVVSPAEPVVAVVGVVIAALAGAFVEPLVPRRFVPDSIAARSRFDQIDVEPVNQHRLADLLDREISRAQRFDQEVAVVSVPLHDEEEDVFAALAAVRSVLRNHDLVAYDAGAHSCCVVAVVPGEEVGRVVATKVINVRAIDGSRARTCFYPENGSTADELLAPIAAWRSPVTRREAA